MLQRETPARAADEPESGLREQARCRGGGLVSTTASVRQHPSAAPGGSTQCTPPTTTAAHLHRHAGSKPPGALAVGALHDDGEVAAGGLDLLRKREAQGRRLRRGPVRDLELKNLPSAPPHTHCPVPPARCRRRPAPTHIHEPPLGPYPLHGLPQLEHRAGNDQPAPLPLRGVHQLGQDAQAALGNAGHGAGSLQGGTKAGLQGRARGRREVSRQAAR